MALVQQKTGNASAVTSVSLAFDSDVTAGNHIIDLVSWYDTSTPNLPVGGITDTQSNTHTIAIQTDTTEASVAIGYAENVAAGATTVTIDPDNTGLYFTAAIVEWSGLASSGSLDKITSNTGTSNSPSVGPTATLSQADEVIFALAVARIPGSSDVGFDVPATTGYTNIYVFQNWTLICSHASDYKEVSNTAGQSAAWGTLTSASANWAAVLATFKATGRVEIEGVGANNTIGAVTLSATGDVDIAGSANITIGAITSSATGTVLITGVGANNTIANVTAAGLGTVLVQGTGANNTIAAVTSTATGTVLVQGTGANNTIGEFTLAGIGSIGAAISGTLDKTIDAVTASATGTVLVQGTGANNTIGAVTASGTGKVEIQGTGATNTIAAVTAAGLGTVRIAGTGANNTIGAVTVSATGSVDVAGTLSSTIGPITVAAIGSVENRGTLDVTVGAVTLAGSGVIGNFISGQLNQSIGIFTVTATAGVQNTVRSMGATIKQGTFNGSVHAKPYSKSRFRQESMKWPSRG